MSGYQWRVSMLTMKARLIKREVIDKILPGLDWALRQARYTIGPGRAHLLDPSSTD